MHAPTDLLQPIKVVTSFLEHPVIELPIQEFRFLCYCERIQYLYTVGNYSVLHPQYFVSPLDYENTFVSLILAVIRRFYTV